MNSKMSMWPTVLFLLVLNGCGQRVEEKFDRVFAGASTTSVGGLRIGDACARSDGWQQPAVGTANIDASSAPVLYDAAYLAAIGWKDFHQLPAGTGYCLPPGGAYPNGYFTMNCSADSDCPDSAFCDGASSTTSGQCRRECSSNADCGSGMSCPTANNTAIAAEIQSHADCGSGMSCPGKARSSCQGPAPRLGRAPHGARKTGPL
jgi:hypothetical protein